jgi:hypothetical protein
MTHLFLQRVSVQLQRAQAQEFRAVLGARGHVDPALDVDQLEMRRLWEQAAWEGAPTLDDTALVAPMAD